MAGDTEWSPFNFTLVRQNIELTCTSYDGSNHSKLSVSAGIYEATSSVPRLSTTVEDKDIVYVKKFEKYLSLHALQERLNDPKRRKLDYATLQKAPDAKPFELWDQDGGLGYIPRSLIRAISNEPYDDKVDEAHLRIWISIAKNLASQPPEYINPYARFSLRPSDALKSKEKNGLLYCSPAELPAYGVTTDKLKAIITANTGRFDGWPDPVVVDYATARDAMGLKLIGRNFLQFYFLWMKVERYEELWKELGVSELLHPLPAEDGENAYNDVDRYILKGSSDGPAVDGAGSQIFSTTPEDRDYESEGLTADKVMGTNAKMVAERLWGTNYITSRMGAGRNGEVSTVEWLHPAAFSFGGQDARKNVVFSTWECSSDIVRAENFVVELTKKNKKRADSKGSLVTVGNAGATLSRFTLAKENMDATVPRWAKYHPWLSFSLNYRHVMGADNCPLNGGIAHDVNFDPWSIYVPLSMEPRLDVMILKDLKSGGSTADIITGIKNYDAYRALARNAAINRLPFVELPDMIVKHPTIASTDESRSNGTPVSEDDYVLHGEIELFGTTVVGNLEKWIGPPPDDVVIGADPPVIERVTIPGDFHLSMLIPLLRGTPFDKIIFRNVAISHQNYAFDKTKSIGWHFNADWVIDSACGLLYDILRTALQVDKPILSIHAAFGQGLQWNAPLNLQSFILEGVFPDLALSPVSGVTLTSIGVQLLGIRGFSPTPQPHSTLSFGFGIFGTMNLDVPGSIVPLNLDYEIGLVGSTVNFRAEISGSIWEDALGVKGLLLEDVAFGTSFSTTSPWKTFAFNVSATFSYLTSQASLQGSYAAGGHFSLTAQVDNFGTEEIDALFYSLFSDSLTLPDFDVNIGSAIITIASGQGLSLSLLDVDVGGYTAASVALSLSSSGVSLSGALTRSTITFGDVELRDALVKLSFWTVDKKKNVDFMIGGTLGVNIIDLEVTAVVHLYPGKGGVEWAVVAELSAPNRAFAISDVVPAVKNSFVDFSLSNAVFIAASKDDPLIGESFPGYHVRKGVQVFGVIDSIPALNDLLREDVKGLVLNAGWSKGSGFNLLVSLPATASINLGNGIKTTPITLGIRTSPLELAITAGITVPVKDSTPLDFSFVLAASLTGASAAAQMKGWWVKPFGVDNLKIGPEVTLSIEIIYAQFVTTGLPSGFGVSGGLMVGTVEAFLAMNISEDPKRQLLFGEIKKLDISDVVEFAGTLVQEDIPQIPDNLLKFEELKVYICPFGVILGQTVYPQGFSFKADLLLFSKRANIECTIDKAQKSVDILGGIDNFELGPLVVRGSKGPRATLECHVGVSRQQLIVDGVVSIFDAQAQTYINVQFLPDPKFKFFLMLEWAKIFMFRLDAELIGSIRDRLSDADFSFYAELQNDILEYIAQQIIEQFEAAKVVAKEGLETAQKKVDEAKKQWEGAIADAQDKVDDAQKKWNSYEKSVRDSSQPVIDKYLKEITRLQGEIDKASRDYQKALSDAQREVNQANQNRASALRTAQNGVESARQQMEKGINDAQRKLDDAERELSRAFGNAKRDIDNAQRKVNGIQNEINSTKRTIREYENASGWAFWKKAQIPILWIKVGALETAKAIANAVLDAARAILTGTEYVAKEAGVRTAREALNLARSAGQTSLSAAQGALRLADETSKAALDAANLTLEGVKTGGKYVAFESAKKALEGFKKANEVAYEAAMTAIQGLMDSAEFIAFNAAKAGLEVAKESTAILDAAREALVIAEKASEVAISVLEDIIKFGAKAVNIKTIKLSGTLRGILGVGGTSARPFSAVIQGYVVGQWFDTKAEFDLKKPVEFITALFKKLWDLVAGEFRLAFLAAIAEQRHVARRDPIDDGQLLATKSRYLQQRPDILRTLIEVSETVLVDIPCGPFSGRQIVPPVIAARKALIMIQEEQGISVFNDIDGL